MRFITSNSKAFRPEKGNSILPREEMDTCCTLQPNPHPENRSQQWAWKSLPAGPGNQSKTVTLRLKYLWKRFMSVNKETSPHTVISKAWIDFLVGLLTSLECYGDWWETISQNGTVEIEKLGYSELCHPKQGALRFAAQKSHSREADIGAYFCIGNSITLFETYLIRPLCTMGAPCT